jgi:hypothetical protein
MASTNEDVVVLATARFADGRLLIMRHLPDRGSVELVWWRRDEAGTTEQLQALELAAEAVEVAAFARLCEQALDTERGEIADGEEIAAAGPFADGARLAALRSGDEVMLVRSPERDNLILLSRAALGELVAKLPAAMQKLTTLGFGLPQQEE